MQPLKSLHVATGPGWQLPLPQVSPTVQALPSSHGAKFGVLMHRPSTHASFVQALPSSQSMIVGVQIGTGVRSTVTSDSALVCPPG